MEVQKLFTELKKLDPMPSTVVSKLGRSYRCREIYRKSLYNKKWPIFAVPSVCRSAGWSNWPQNGFGSRTFEYLGALRGDFKFFDFFQNGGHF